MMNCSSELALCTGDQLECARKTKQDRQQHSHLQPVKEQGKGFESHFHSRALGFSAGQIRLSIGRITNRGWTRALANRYSKEISLPRILIKYSQHSAQSASTRRRAVVVSRKLSPLVVTPLSKEATESMIEAYPTEP
jgi:hypothetical protein